MRSLAALGPCYVDVVVVLPDAALGWIVPEPGPGWPDAVRAGASARLADELAAALRPLQVVATAAVVDGPAPSIMASAASDGLPDSALPVQDLAAAAARAAAEALPRVLRRAKREADRRRRPTPGTTAAPQPRVTGSTA